MARARSARLAGPQPRQHERRLGIIPFLSPALPLRSFLLSGAKCRFQKGACGGKRTLLRQECRRRPGPASSPVTRRGFQPAGIKPAVNPVDKQCRGRGPAAARTRCQSSRVSRAAGRTEERKRALLLQLNQENVEERLKEMQNTALAAGAQVKDAGEDLST